MLNLTTMANIYIVPDNIPNHMRCEKFKQSPNVLFAYAVAFVKSSGNLKQSLISVEFLKNFRDPKNVVMSVT